jgi:hypothetical protein
VSADEEDEDGNPIPKKKPEKAKEAPKPTETSAKEEKVLTDNYYLLYGLIYPRVISNYYHRVGG